MTRRLAALVAVLALVLAAEPAPARQRAAVPLRIMTIGDSLTSGHGGSGPAGYRRELGARLTAAGIDHVFTAAGAHVGATLQDLRAGIAGWLAADQPDLVLVSIGTNNAAMPLMGGFEPLYIDLVNTILAWSPAVKVGIGQVLYSNAGFSPALVYVNVAAIHAAWWQTPGGQPRPGGRVALADLSTIHACQTYDGVHLRDSGYDVMGRIWYRALALLMGWPALTYSDHLPAQRRPGFERTATITC